MAERWDDRPDAERRDETHDPRNPPNSVVNAHARRLAWNSYFVPLVVLFAVMGVGLLYWVSRGPDRVTHEPDREEVGTVGERTPGVSASPGGGDPAPALDSARDELKYRGDDKTQSGRIELRNVEVEAAQANNLMVRDGADKKAVIAPVGSPEIKQGMHIDVDGTAESDGSGGTRIRATRVEIKK